MRSLVALAFLTSLAAQAQQLPRLVPFIDRQAHVIDARKLPSSAFERFVKEGTIPTLVEPFVFWSTDGLLCVPASGDAQRVECQDPATGARQQRKRPRPVTLPVKSLELGGATLAQDGTITNGEQRRVSKLRCGRSAFLDAKEYRYLPGPDGRLAVLVLEIDDVRQVCATLDVQCGLPGEGPRWWRVLVARPSCPGDTEAVVE
jgi:hypothetical protein